MMVHRIDPDRVVAFVRHLNITADVGWRTVNADYDSWAMDIRVNDVHLEISWGSLTGFGGTDREEERRLAESDDYNPFAPFSHSFKSMKDAEDWIRPRIIME